MQGGAAILTPRANHIRHNQRLCGAQRTLPQSLASTRRRGRLPLPSFTEKSPALQGLFHMRRAEQVRPTQHIMRARSTPYSDDMSESPTKKPKVSFQVTSSSPPRRSSRLAESSPKQTSPPRPRRPRLDGAPSVSSAISSNVSDYGYRARDTQETSASGPPQISADTGPSKLDDSLAGVGKDRAGGDDPSSLYQRLHSEGKSLSDLLYEARKPDLFDKTAGYLPASKLQKICSNDTIEAELLLRGSPEQARTCAAFIVRNEEQGRADHKNCSREIFAILAWIRAIHLVPKFEEANVRDNELPFVSDDGNTVFWTHKKGRRLYLFDEVGATIREEFFRTQW